MKIYTYIDFSVRSRTTQAKLAALWAESWQRHGWEPVIIGPPQIGKLGKELEPFLRFLPTVNARSYEDACYLRWAAMAELGGGWMSDADVINYGFRPDPAFLRKKILESYDPHAMFPISAPVVCDNHVPCLVFGTEMAYYATVQRFWSLARDHKSFPREQPHIKTINGRLHTSDMLIIEQMQKGEEYVPIDLVKEYGEDGWCESPLVHFASGRCGGEDKVTVINRERPI